MSAEKLAPLQVTMRPLASLIPYARNARTHSPEQVKQLAASIVEFGWTNPVLVDGENGIIAGHGRVLAAELLKREEVPCIELAHLSGAQKRAYILADNKLALNAGWDEEMLALEIADLQALDFGLDVIGFPADVATTLGVGVAAIEMPPLPSGDRAPIQQMTFTLHDEQVEQVKAALERAKALGPFDSPNENSNGNALARICETFLTGAE